ncbi:hypothetical protein BGW36DRAFT_287589 [Talaromyces proteolyticus]|uniref:Uncharacterized protein n=1 Tax=Talaromyces proteolyticus TaxID=1131652 RepID=A0AAD4L1N1_9EURO|nr:uncharacterized protein BGW36DRAFT_287589 [Talaromyces proteolyticus]KAH8703890.1 hypothetical protein BGW36DRAFT_287589 [Talaromyces proteolyticus]
MSWQEIDPGRYERPFDTIERNFWDIAAFGSHLKKQHYLISSAVQFKNLPSVTAVKQAWMMFRHKHPQIAVVPDANRQQLVYTVPSPEDLDAWVQETLSIYADNESRSAEDLTAELSPCHLFMLHYLPSSRELLFRTPHWRTDGVGLIHLQHEFCSLLAQGPSGTPLVFDGSEISRFPPPMDKVTGIPLKVTPQMSQAADRQSCMPASFREALSSTSPAAPRRIGTHFTRDVSQQIITASKARGVTITTSVHAALVKAMLPHVTASDGRLIGFGSFDIRGLLPQPWNGVAGGAGLYLAGKPSSIEFTNMKEFTSIAGYLTTYYQRRDLQQLLESTADCVSQVGAILAAPPEVMLDAPGAAHPELSSLGVIEQRLPSRYTGATAILEIENWWLGVDIINRVLQMYVWTRDGQLHLTCHYNEAFYERDFIKRFLEEWEAVLVTELIF